MGRLRKNHSKRAPKNSLQGHKRSVLLINMVTLMLGGVVLFGGMSLKARNDEYKVQERELQARIEAEEERSAEIEELKDYVGTDEYIESVAKEKLGLVHEGEILFKEE